MTMFILWCYIRGFKYYIRAEDVYGDMKYSYQGLINNATEFINGDEAKMVRTQIQKCPVLNIELRSKMKLHNLNPH